MMRAGIFAGTLFILLVSALGAMAQVHPNQLPPLTADALFPRCTARQLTTVGFPDHKHAFLWPGWEVLKDADGRTYGPQSFCQHHQLIPRPDLVITPGTKRIGAFTLKHNPGYRDCDMLQFLELMDWAGHEVPALLGLPLPDSLEIINPDNLGSYGELTGYGIWRLYSLQGNRVIMEPWPILQGRTLDAHAAFMLVTDWVLRTAVGAALPPWLQQGLVEYCGEDGQHLVNYMAQFRSDGPVVMPPALVDALLTKEPDPEPMRDREVFRRACYNAFLMAWELVENRGGLEAMQECLQLMVAGEDFSSASQKVYGLNAEELAASLDPVILGEPGGKNPPLPVPHKQP